MKVKPVICTLSLFAVFISGVFSQNTAGGVSEPQKFALVIGNSNYSGISRLTNPVNDANDMEAALRGLGFTVDKILDGNLERIENAVLNLKRRLGGSRNTYGFFYYAGHGVQSGGGNYLIPVTADNIRSENQLRERAVSLQFVLDSLSEAGNELNMVVLDACRDNPFGWARSGSRGLSVVGQSPTGTIVMYAAGAGQTASDGTGRNGLFTGHLLNNLKTPNLSVFDVFDRTMGDVIDVTRGGQHPELSLRFPGATRAFLGRRPAPPSAPLAAPLATQPAAASTVPAPPTAPPTAQPPVQVTPVPSTTTPAAVTQRPVTERPAPGLVRVESGTFMMADEAGIGIRQVTVNSFSMGRYPVTQSEWVKVMGANPSNFKGDNLPVENVSWYNAIVFCNRLSIKEGLTPAYEIQDSSRIKSRRRWTTDPGEWGNVPVSRDDRWDAVRLVAGSAGYRLPTEAQWEYAARGGNGSPGNFEFSGSNAVDEVAWHLGNSGGKTREVGMLKPNNLGLYDMSGNVWEWCWDSSGNARVLRGGGWSSNAVGTRSVDRYYYYPNLRWSYYGFRLARP